MKTLILIFCTFLSFSFAHAQQNYQEILTSLTQNSENDFADIIGKKVDEDEISNYYESKVKLNVGNEFILQSMQTKAAMYLISCKYSDAKELEKEIRKFLDQYKSNSSYEITETKATEKGNYTLKVHQKHDIEDAFILEVLTDASDNTQYLSLMIIGKEMKN